MCNSQKMYFLYKKTDGRTPGISISPAPLIAEAEKKKTFDNDIHVLKLPGSLLTFTIEILGTINTLVPYEYLSSHICLFQKQLSWLINLFFYKLQDRETNTQTITLI